MEEAKVGGADSGMAAEQGAKGLIYHGYRRQSSGQVVMVESEDGEPIGVLNHVVQHSPSGLNWGYHGSGPSDTAFNLMAAALGAAAVVPRLCRNESGCLRGRR